MPRPAASRTARALILVFVLALVAAACSRPETRKVATQEKRETDFSDLVGSSTTAVADASAPAPSQAAAATKPAPQRTAAGTPARLAGDDAQARAVGALVKPQTIARKKPYYLGVGENTIKIAVSEDREQCGVNVIAAITAAGGAIGTGDRFYRPAPTTPEEIRGEFRESADNLVKFFNDNALNALQYFPQLKDAMEKERGGKIDPKYPIWGRRFEHVMVDGGSAQCPEKTRAASIEAAEQQKVFVVHNTYDGAQYNMAASLNTVPSNRRPMHFGTYWLMDSIYTQFAPYVWTPFATGTTITRQLANYTCSRLVGQKASRSPDPANRALTRKFGLITGNAQDQKAMANEFKGYIKKYCDKDIIAIAVEYNYGDIAAAQADASNIAVQMKTQGVTSVLMLTDPVFGLFMYVAAENQQYSPEWIWTSYGFGDASTVQRLYKDTGDQNAGSFGLSQLGIPGGFGYNDPPGDPFLAYHAYHQKSPTSGKQCDPSSDAGMNHDNDYCRAPGSIVLMYYSILPLVGGTLFAGPDLTPLNVTKGLQSYPTTRYGGRGPTSDPRPALVGAGPGKHGFVVDAVEWRWRRDFTSPPPEKKAQWVEWPDCQRHYLNWPNELAPQWERNGPNYNAWCGDPKTGYPRLK